MVVWQLIFFFISIYMDWLIIMRVGLVRNIDFDKFLGMILQVFGCLVLVSYGFNGGIFFDLRMCFGWVIIV